MEVNIIFLDIDGVLCLRRDIERTCLLNLKSIVDATSARIVLSSSWRGKIELAFRDVGINRLLGWTSARGKTRVDEIYSWMKNFDNITIDQDIIIKKWIAIDDMNLLQLDAQRMQNHFVLTDIKYGITEETISMETREICTQLLSSLELVPFSGKKFRMETLIWRDFMPQIHHDNHIETSKTPGSGLIGKIKIVTDDFNNFPNGIKANLAWFILDQDNIWKTALVEERLRSQEDCELITIAREGPKWGPGVKVDVIIQLQNIRGETVLLQAKQQNIYETC